jgi:hypothetical protein
MEGRFSSYAPLVLPFYTRDSPEINASEALFFSYFTQAGDEARTHDIYLGKVTV